MIPAQDALPSIDIDRAELRSLALREPFESSHVHVGSVAADAPVIPEPSPDQCLLEALVIGRLGCLFDPERTSREAEDFVPLAISARVDHFTLTVRGRNLPAVLHRLTPRWEARSDIDEIGVDNGIPGLRWLASEHGAGVTFHRPGLRGRFTIEGMSITAFDEYRRAALIEAGEESVHGDDALTLQERLTSTPDADSCRVASVIGRRLGLLLEPGVTAIDSWWNTADRFAVELIVRDDAPDPVPRILSLMQSPHLAPQVRLKGSGGGHHYLAVDGSTAEIDLRILWVPAT